MRYGPRSHQAACNALTMLSHLLDTSDADRAYILNDELLERFFLLQRGFPLVDWQFYLAMRRKADRQLPLSKEFVSVLRRAGLRAWLDPSSDFRTGPSGDPRLEFLTRTFEVGTGFTARTFTLLNVLKGLAQHVDFTKYQDPISADPLPLQQHADSPSHEQRVAQSSSGNNGMGHFEEIDAKDGQLYNIDDEKHVYHGHRRRD